MDQRPPENIGEILIKLDCCQPEQITEALAIQEKQASPQVIGIILIELGYITVENLISALAVQEDSVKNQAEWIDLSNRLQVELLQKSKAYNKMAADQQRSLLNLLVHCTARVYTSKDIICHQDDPSDNFYIVISGSVKVSKKLPQGENTLSYLGPASTFGESALMLGAKQPHTMISIGVTVVSLLSQDLILRAIEQKPNLYQDFLVVVCQSLNVSNALLEQQTIREQAIRQLLTQKDDPPDLIGVTRHIRNLMNQIMSIAPGFKPALIIGEKGTEKDIVANMIHDRSSVAENLLLTVDCKAIPLLPLSFIQDKLLNKETLAEISQTSFLFGHEPGYFSTAAGKRFGYIETVKTGTLVLQNIEHIKKGVQQKLLDLINNHAFCLLGSDKLHKVKIRIIVTTEMTLENIDKQKNDLFYGPFLEQLSQHFLYIPPLRNRKKDLKIIVRSMVQKYCKYNQTRIKGVSKEALNKIITYDWPQNTEELDLTIKKAVTLCKEKKIESEHLFFNIDKISETEQINLLKLPFLELILQSKYYPMVIQVAVFIAFILNLIALYFDINFFHAKFNLIMAWQVGWPLIILSTFFVGRFYCSICPFASVSTLLQTTIKFGNKTAPPWLKRWGPYASVIGFLIIIWVEIAFDLHKGRGKK